MDYKKHSYDKCRFPLYFILTARNAILSGGYLLPHYISVSIYLVACSQAICLGELTMLEVIIVKRL